MSPLNHIIRLKNVKVVLNKLIQRSIQPKHDLITTKAKKAQINSYECLESKH